MDSALDQFRPILEKIFYIFMGFLVRAAHSKRLEIVFHYSSDIGLVIGVDIIGSNSSCD